MLLNIYGDIDMKEKEKEQKKYKTRQRAYVLRCLTENKASHMTVDEIIFWLRKNGAEVGKTTVYRTLDKLIQTGLVRKYICENGKSACYQYADTDEKCLRHFHLKCLSCGRLIHLECERLEELERHISHHHRFFVDNTKTVLYGTCGECSNG